MSIGILITLMLFYSFYYPIPDNIKASTRSQPSEEVLQPASQAPQWPRSQPSEEVLQPASQALQLPRIYDIDLKAEVIFVGLDFPTSMAFLGPNDILVLEKNKGTIQRLTNGNMFQEPLLDVNVSKHSERGMLGIDVEKNENNATVRPSFNLFVYFTESAYGDGDNQTLGNHLYKYELLDNDSRLVNPKKLLGLPSSPGPAHNGGKLKIGPDNNVYFTVGNLNLRENEHFLTKAENLENGKDPDGRAGILRITQDGLPVANGSIIGDKYPLNLYYAYGMRNSFGIDFDPVTGKLWDTENGPEFGDEINLVEPGFNSGWNKLQGLWEGNESAAPVIAGNMRGQNILVDFDRRGVYSDPELSWKHSVGLTAIKFLDSKIYGNDYENDLFASDVHNGNIYHFDLTKDRKALELNGLLKDKIANGPEELKANLFGQGFGAITDMEVGPDGYLYILSEYQRGECTLDEYGSCVSYNPPELGTVFRIVPNLVTTSST